MSEPTGLFQYRNDVLLRHPSRERPLIFLSFEIRPSKPPNKVFTSLVTTASNDTWPCAKLKRRQCRRTLDFLRKDPEGTGPQVD